MSQNKLVALQKDIPEQHHGTRPMLKMSATPVRGQCPLGIDICVQTGVCVCGKLEENLIEQLHECELLAGFGTGTLLGIE
eukprot:508978-Hanusia_phi.AAC.2